jgi:hypothetical protein
LPARKRRENTTKTKLLGERNSCFFSGVFVPAVDVDEQIGI